MKHMKSLPLAALICAAALVSVAVMADLFTPSSTEVAVVQEGDDASSSRFYAKSTPSTNELPPPSTAAPLPAVSAALHQCCSNALPTAGLFNDEFNTGNDDECRTGEGETAVRSSSVDAVQLKEHQFVSSIQRATANKRSPQCFYRLQNFCVIRGALVLFVPKSEQQHSPRSFRLCNELRGKINLHFSIEDPPVHPPHPVSSQPAHVAACWQLYGYHMFQCLASLFTVQSEHKMHNVRMWLYNHAQSFPKIAREHYSNAMYLGSAASFLDSVPNSQLMSQFSVRPSKYWQLWSQNTNSPGDISELKKFPFSLGASGCYKFGLVGQPDPRNLSTAARRRHAQHLRSVFRLPERCACGAMMHFVLAQRNPNTSRVQGVRRILNVDEIADFVRKFTPGNKTTRGDNSTAGFSVDVVDWATLSVQQQAEVAASADVLLSSHGAGNTWLALQQPRSVFIEVWPDCLARNVYLVMASQYNIRYYALCHYNHAANFMHTDVRLSLAKLGNVLHNAWLYLRRARCGL